jgi:predicted DNA-binding transcriptional regulator YafY
MNNKKYYSDVKFTARELIAILNVLKHCQQFGQSVAPEDTIHEIIQKIQNSNETKI